jgi:hypothetical protein
MALEDEFSSTMGDLGNGMYSLIDETLPATMLLVVGMGVAFVILEFMRRQMENAHEGK